MRIDRKLNIVVPVETDEGTIYVHSTPITRDVFEKYFLVISKTFAMMMRERLDVIGGPRVAMMMLRATAEETGTLDGRDGVEAGLVAEIHRLTNVAVPGDRGWRMIPYDDAVRDSTITKEDASEVDNFLAFFTVSSHMFQREDVRGILAGMQQLWGVRTTSSSCTEWLSTLLTSTETVSSGETETISSVPS